MLHKEPQRAAEKAKGDKNFLLHMFYRYFARIPAVTIAFF